MTIHFRDNSNCLIGILPNSNIRVDGPFGDRMRLHVGRPRLVAPADLDVPISPVVSYAEFAVDAFYFTNGSGSIDMQRYLRVHQPAPLNYLEENIDGFVANPFYEIDCEDNHARTEMPLVEIASSVGDVFVREVTPEGVPFKQIRLSHTAFGRSERWRNWRRWSMTPEERQREMELAQRRAEEEVRRRAEREAKERANAERREKARLKKERDEAIRRAKNPLRVVRKVRLGD